MHPDHRMSTTLIHLAAEGEATDALGQLVLVSGDPTATPHLLPVDRRPQLGGQMLQLQASPHRAGQSRQAAAAQTEVAESLDPLPPPG